MGAARRTHGGEEDTYTILVGKHAWQRSLGRPRRRWE